MHNAKSTKQGTCQANKASLPDAAVDLATKLFDCARNNDAKTIAQYIDKGLPLNLKNRKGDTMLMLAAYNGGEDVVRLLLRHNADTDLLNDRQQSPLAGAVFKGYTEIVRLLIRADAKTDIGHPTAIDTAKIFKRDDLLEILRDGGKHERI